MHVDQTSAQTVRAGEASWKKHENCDNSGSKKLDVKDMELMRNYTADLRNVLNSASITQQKGVLKSFVKKIEVSKPSVSIE